MAKPASPSPLAELNAHIQRARTQAFADEGWGNDDPQAQRGLRSAARFQALWARIRTEDDVDQAVQRAPRNAGPLNSHMLVLRTLATLRGVSPDYLRRFMLQMDAWLWLEQAQRRGKATTAAKGKTAKRPRSASKPAGNGP